MVSSPLWSSALGSLPPISLHSLPAQPNKPLHTSGTPGPQRTEWVLVNTAVNGQRDRAGSKWAKASSEAHCHMPVGQGLGGKASRPTPSCPEASEGRKAPWEVWAASSSSNCILHSKSQPGAHLRGAGQQRLPEDRVCHVLGLDVEGGQWDSSLGQAMPREGWDAREHPMS